MGVGVEKVRVDKWFLKNLNDAAHEFFLASYIAFFYFDTFSFLYLLFYIYICCIKTCYFYPRHESDYQRVSILVPG